MNAFQLLLQKTVALGAQESQVVETGARWWRGDGIGGHIRVDGGEHLVGLSVLQVGTLEPDLDAGQVKRIIAQLDPLAAQEGGHPVAIAVKREGGGLGNLALVAMQEGDSQIFGVNGADRRGRVLALTLERGLAGLAVELAVIDDLDPGQQRLVER